jgi:hypothetical protein
MAMINDERGPFRHLKWRELKMGQKKEAKKIDVM